MRAASLVVVALVSTAVAMWQWVKLAARYEQLRDRVAELERRSAEPPAPPPDLGQVRAELRACEQRTDYLREVQRAVCSPDGYGRRVRAPDPPPGWAPWPTYPTTGAWASPP